MSQKIHPNMIRLGIILKFHSYWYIFKVYYWFFITEDNCIRIFVYNIFNRMRLQIQIERQNVYIRLRIYIYLFSLISKIEIKFLKNLYQSMYKTCNNLY